MKMDFENEENEVIAESLKDKLVNFGRSLLDDKKKLAVVIILVIFIVYLFNGCSAAIKERQNQSNTNDTVVDTVVESPTSENTVNVYNMDLFEKQPNLVSKYGNLQEGFMWDYDGTVLSLGDKSLTAEEAMYSYLNGIRTLDFSSAQRFSRDSFVVSRYNNFYSADTSRGSSYQDNFYRNMYTLVLMSMQTHKVTNTATFADNKQVFTVELEIIDLSNKDFWVDDADNIYHNLYIYEQNESDISKSEQYIYDYILDYYKSEDAKKKVITVNLTVEKDATLDTGWLVTIDKDIDNYCYYTDGITVNKYILTQYRSEGREAIREEIKEAEESSNQ